MTTRSPRVALAAPIHGDELVLARVGVAVRQRRLEAEHGASSSGGRSASGRRGQPGRPSAGLSATELCPPGYQAGVASRLVLERPQIRPRRARLVPVPRRRRTGHLRRQGQVAAPAALQLLRRPGAAAPPHPADGREGALGRVDPGAHRGRGDHARVQPDQGAPAPLQRPAEGRQELPVARRHDRRDLAPRRDRAGHEAQGHALLRPLRTRLRRSATRSTCSCGRSRSGPARTPSSPATSGSGGRACSSTSSAARARASAR